MKPQSQNLSMPASLQMVEDWTKVKAARASRKVSPWGKSNALVTTPNAMAIRERWAAQAAAEARLLAALSR